MDASLIAVIVAAIILLAFLSLGVNVGITLGTASMVGMAIFTGRIETALHLSVMQTISVTTTYGFIVIPLFVLLASFASETDITQGLFNAAYRWLGRLPGGAAMATIATCAGMAALTGSSAATAATMSRVAYPELRRFGYEESISIGACCVGGTLAIMIPPSITFVLYAMFAEQSIGKLLIAGIGPGILLAILFCMSILIRVIKHQELAPKSSKFTFKEKVASLKGVFPFIALISIISLGILYGIWTPVEAAAVGVIVIFLMSVLWGKLSVKKAIKSSLESVITSAAIMIVVVGSMMFGQFLAATGFNAALAKSIIELNIPPVLFFTILMIAYMILGMFLEATSILALTVPLLNPVVIAIGWSPIWFGVVLVLMMEVALVTPPVGLNLYAVKATCPEIRIETIFRGSLPYLYMCAIVIVLLYMFPIIALFLPGLM
jgi:tripartite ATP-independent transporter DctM subunit